MIRAMTMIACAMLVGPGSPTHAASALLMGDGTSGLIAPQDGQLQLWAPGEEKPRWKLSIGGIGIGARSRVAAIALRPNGDVLLVERLGDILTVSPEGRELSRHKPIYEYVRLAVEFPK